jgi:hypothetical protein
VVENDALLENVLQATREVVGDLDKPGNGILVVLPTVSVHGLVKPRPGNETGS